jgi:hypothetical protein
MNWIKRNIALVAVLVLGLLATAASAYLAFSASSSASEKSASLQRDCDTLKRTQNAKPAPIKENAELLDTQASALEDLAGKLESRLLESNLPPPTRTETGFQDALNKLLREVKSKAQDLGITLSGTTGDFALDFDRYTKEVPKQNLLPTLSRQLVESEFLVQMILKHQPLEIRRFEREKAPEEDPNFKQKPPEPPKPTPPPTKKAPQKEPEPESKPSPAFQSKIYQITLLSRPETVRGILTDLATSKRPFAIVKSITVSNEKKDGPKRKTENPLTPETADPLQSLYIVGEERVETAIAIELLTFREPTPNGKPVPSSGPKKN